MTHKELAQKCSSLLQENQEWRKRYSKYIRTILKVQANKTSQQLFYIRKPFSRYSAISSEGKYIFDIRFGGQSIGYVQLKKNNGETKPYLVVKPEKVKKNIKYFDPNNVYDVLGKPLDVEWKSNEASAFRSAFTQIGKKDIHNSVKSPEHYIENMMLKEFDKGYRSMDKRLTNITPVVLPGGFFQMPTPFRASKHNEEPKYVNQNGGGIDILARSRHSARDGRICVMELKDENKKSEPQTVVIEQAITYATFIANLVREEQTGKDWWNLIKPKSPYPKDSVIDIDVVSVMPGNSDSENEEEEIIYLGRENVNLHVYSLYFEMEEDFKSVKEFSGTFPSVLMK